MPWQWQCPMTKHNVDDDYDVAVGGDGVEQLLRPT